MNELTLEQEMRDILGPDFKDNTQFSKDTSVHNTEISAHNIPTIISQPAVPLPQAVKKFCSEINLNFEKTAANAIVTAERLEKAAMDLRKYAADLRDAAPDVSGHVERWIRYEREAHGRESFLRTLFDGG